jgi:hypothetical protein
MPGRMRPDKASAVSVDRVGDQIGPEDWARDRYFRTAFETNLVCNFTNMVRNDVFQRFFVDFPVFYVAFSQIFPFFVEL